MHASACFVSEWLASLREDAAGQAQKRWDEYFRPLVRCAERLAGECPPGAIDAESVAASVFASLCKGVKEGRLKSVTDHDSMWWLLLALARRKVADRVRKQTAKKRGGGAVRFSIDGTRDGSQAFLDITAEDPTPDYLVAVQDQFDNLLSKLRDARLRRIAVLRLEGYTNKEIQAEVGVSRATVDRKLKLIRETLAEEWQDE